MTRHGRLSNSQSREICGNPMELQLSSVHDHDTRNQKIAKSTSHIEKGTVSDRVVTKSRYLLLPHPPSPLPPKPSSTLVRFSYYTLKKKKYIYTYVHVNILVFMTIKVLYIHRLHLYLLSVQYINLSCSAEGVTGLCKHPVDCW